MQTARTPRQFTSPSRKPSHILTASARFQGTSHACRAIVAPHARGIDYQKGIHMTRFALAAAAIAAAASHAAATDLVGIASFSAVDAGILYSIDAATGNATEIGSTGVAGIVGIEWDDTTNTLFAYTTNSSLYTINPFTADATLVATAFGVTAEGGLASLDGVLFGTRTGELGQIDTSTAAFSSVGVLDVTLDYSALTFDPTGTLWGYAAPITGDHELYTIDTATGDETLVGTVGFDSPSPVAGMDFDAESASLFLSDGTDLYTLDTSTAAACIRPTHPGRIASNAGACSSAG